MKKCRVLVVCTYNSVRSQMAEGLFRAIGGERYDVESAGVVASAPNRLAILAMREIGIDIGGQRSKSIDRFRWRDFDWVIPFSPEARDAVSGLFPHANKLYWEEPDPNLAPGTEEERLAAFRESRDRIRRRIAGFLVEKE